MDYVYPSHSSSPSQTPYPFTVSMGVAPSKSAENELRLAGSPSKQSQSKRLSRSPLGSCPSTFAFPKASDPFIVGDGVESKGTESSSGSPDPSSSGSEHRGGRWASTSSSDSFPCEQPNATRAWLSWRALPSNHEHSKTAAPPDSSESTSCPPKVLILAPRRSDGRNRTRSVPVKHPEHQPSHTLSAPISAQPVEEDDSERLQQLYDMRTWHLYMRITEARKKQAASTHRIAQTYPHSRDQHNHHPLDDHTAAVDAQDSSGHPFIFGDLE